MPDKEMMDELKQSLIKLHGTCVTVRGDRTGQEGSVLLEFVSGEWLTAASWRIAGDGLPRLSSFDHLQQYGLAAPMDAIRELRELIGDKRIVRASLDERTGDAVLDFEGGVSLQVLNIYGGNEVWEFRFLGGGGAWSNYA